MIKVNSDLLIWRYKKKYHHEIRGIRCVYGFDGEHLIRQEAKIKNPPLSKREGNYKDLFASSRGVR